MSLALLLDDLAEARIEVRVEDGKLRYRAPEGALTPELRDRLGAHREPLIRHLSGQPPLEPEIAFSPASAAQERLWFLHQMQGPNCTYNIPMALRLRGPLDREALHAALDDLVRRHQSLRCFFELSGETLRLGIVRDARAPWEEADLSALNNEARRTRLGEWAGELARWPFDLSRAPLMRVLLLGLGPKEHILAVNFHHIVADGWSFGIILRELAAGYEARLAGRAPALPPLEWQYTDAVAWQDRLRKSGAMDADLAFWRERLADAPVRTTMPPDLRRPPEQSFAGFAVPWNIDAPTTARLRARAREWGASLNHLTLAATAARLADFSGRRDLVIGLPLANRTRRELESVIGMFVNVVPLRIAVPPGTRPGELVERVKRASTEALEHGHLRFEDLVKEIGAARDLSLNPVFQMAYDFLPPIESRLSFGGLEAEVAEIFGESGISKYDCTLYLEERGGGLAGHIEYAASLYRRDTVQRWARAYVAILNAMLDHPDAPLSAPAGAGSAAREPVEAWCAGPVVPLPEGSPWARFEAVARDQADQAAVEEGDQRTSYAELARRAAIVSARLAERGIGPGARVGLCFPRGGDYLAAMLGVVRRGAVFVPFDHEQPVERLAQMAAQARLAAVLFRPGDPAMATLALERIPISAALWDESHAVPAPVHAGQEDPLYMIFTSGSTGVAKAVSVPWRGLCNLGQSLARGFELKPGERVSQIASPSFDASLLEIWPALVRGCTLVIVPEPFRLDPEALGDWLVRARISVHFSPTPLAEALLDLAWPVGTPLRLLATGGQTLHKRPRPGLPFALVNNYGPTETSIAATSGRVEAGRSDGELPSIGRPIDNTILAILDESGRPSPVGTIGELYISGAGVALEYFGNPDATSKSFVTLPDAPSRRWYRTGDRVRLRPEGELEFAGRADRQIKLRGYRIELGEIEAALRRIPGIQQAGVRLEGEHLVAYVEAGERELDLSQVRRRIATALPAYMNPAHLVVMDRLPRQSSGKIDLKTVPPYHPPEGVDGVAAAPIMEGDLAAAVSRAWAKTLKSPVRGVDDNFFDLGGHSLMLVRLRDQIRMETGREIGVLDLFRHPTIASQVSLLAGDAPKPETRVSSRRPSPDGGIAIIGMAGRFPEADNVESFWKNLCEGRECVRTFTREELLSAGIPPEVAGHPDYVPANAILRDIDLFDADFFGIPAREAEVMDPQQRLLLEEAWHAFEDAGYDPARIEGRVGVFAGSSLSGYLVENVLPRRDVVESLGGFTVLINNDKDFAATRISYKLDLRGPSVSVNTACSTSLVAVHQAVTALRDGQCELALAGGACVRSRQIDGYRYEEGGVLSRDGRCRAFDAAATGMVGGNGVAWVVLKPLEDAVADGDPIYAVIKGIAVNNDGADKVGFTAPGLRGQSLVIRDALERAGVAPQTVLYVETHGTGTQLGDSIEVAALAENYASEGGRTAPLSLGALKTNIGHLDTAAGVAGLIKTALCLRERTLVPTLHFRVPNPQIRWPGDSFKVCVQTAPFGESTQPRRAAVSSLGIGGTNAHAVLEEAPARVADGMPDTTWPVLLLLSGKSAPALEANALALAAWLRRHPDARMRDVAHTLAFGRRHWECRRAVCAATAAEAAKLLREPCASPDPRESGGRATVASPDRGDGPEAEWRRALESAGTRWSAGLSCDLDELFARTGKGQRIPLPGYAFQRKRYWLDAVSHSATPPPSTPVPVVEPEEGALPVAASADPSWAEARVIAVMRELLGPERLSRDSDFFLQGGDSLSAVRLASRLKEVFGSGPTQAQIMNARTPANIAALLEDGAPEPGPDEAGGCLVRLGSGTASLPPLVLAHAVGGGVFIYRDLLRALATPHPVYGLQAPGLWDDTPPLEGLRRQARYYHACLLRAGIDRPALIGGSSYGGLLAYELDRLYQQSGHRASLVALFDSPGPGYMSQRLESEEEICAYMLARDTPGSNFATDLVRMRALDHPARFALLLDYLRRTKMPQATVVDVERLVRVFRQNLINLWNWIPEPHDARLLFLKAREPDALLANDPELAWVPLAGAGIEILPVDGNHSTMLSFPHVKTVAREINRRLSLALAGRSGGGGSGAPRMEPIESEQSSRQGAARTG